LNVISGGDGQLQHKVLIEITECLTGKIVGAVVVLHIGCFEVWKILELGNK
jgi:hypothetical protein